MASRFTQYGGAAGAEAELRQMVAARIAAQMAAQKQAMEVHKLGQADRGLDLEGGRLQEDVRQFDAAAPQRAAQTGYLTTQSEHLKGAPTREADSRAHDMMKLDVQNQNELGQIKAGGDQQARVAGIRSANVSQPKSMADELAEFEAKEKIKAQYGGSRPSLGAERTALAFFNRAQQASKDIATIEPEIAKAGLLAQGQLQYAHNALQTPKQQAYRQGQRAFTEARLRKESGAAIPTAEYENDAKTYFAVPGDDETIIAQKQAARQVVLDGLKFQSGKAYEEYYGQPNQSPAQQQQGGGGMVPMVAPDGRQLNVPAERVAEMEAKGAKRR